MYIKQKIYDQFNLQKQADELGIKIWQTPSFLFIVMGVIIMSAMAAVYFSSLFADSPENFIMMQSLMVIFLFTIGNFIIRSVEEVAKANKMKSEFVSVASHQLKTPLAEINWQIELLVSKFSKGLDKKQAELIKEITHSAGKMGRLVNDLLDVARIDQGQLALTSEKVDMCKLVEDTVAEQQVLAKAAKVELRTSCPVTSLDIVGDKRRILVVFDNLISNAIKYIGERGGTVEVFMEPQEKGLQVCIRDNGVGIPMAEQGKLFQKFFRSNNESKNKTDGTGLGLYIAKNIIEQSGGKIWFNSTEHVGSEFYFTLPFENKQKGFVNKA